MIKKEISHLGLHYQIVKFLMKHENDYTKKEKEFILKNYTWGKKDSLVTDILRQIYEELDLLEENQNIYQGFIDLVEENFGINQNIIEVGGGKIPVLAKRLAKQQKKGTVTVYDDQLITKASPIPNLTLIKKRVTSSQQLPNKDLIIGFMPCEGTETTIKLAKENKLDFMIALCDGTSHNIDFMAEDDWELRMLYEARKAVEQASLGTLEKTYMKNYHNPYPVIFNKRKSK